MIRKLISRMGNVAAIFMVLFLAAGCMPKIEYGEAPNVGKLRDLQVGVSTKANVRDTLGVPRGDGKLRMANKELVEAGRAEEVREIWYYELTRLDGLTAHIKILLVFFNGDTYDGHLSFAASELMDTT